MSILKLQDDLHATITNYRCSVIDNTKYLPHNKYLELREGPPNWPPLSGCGIFRVRFFPRRSIFPVLEEGVSFGSSKRVAISVISLDLFIPSGRCMRKYPIRPAFRFDNVLSVSPRYQLWRPQRERMITPRYQDMKVKQRREAQTKRTCV